MSYTLLILQRAVRQLLYLAGITITTLFAAACHQQGATHDGVTIGAITISRAYMVAPIGTAPAVLYFTVHNAGTGTDTLTGIRVGGVDRAELHMTIESPMVNPATATPSPSTPPMTMTTMVPTPVVPVPPGSTLCFAPGGRHIMLMGVSQFLHRGDSTYATLTFRHVGPIRISVHIIDYTQLDTLVSTNSAR